MLTTPLIFINQTIFLWLLSDKLMKIEYVLTVRKFRSFPSIPVNLIFYTQEHGGFVSPLLRFYSICSYSIHFNIWMVIQPSDNRGQVA